MIELIAEDRRSEREGAPQDPPGRTVETVPRLRILPEHPLVQIRPSKKWAPVDLREVWAYKDLLTILVIRDVTVRYKQTFLGIAWAVFQPVMMMIVYSVVFGKFGQIPSEGIPYPLFAFAALLPWTFVANAVQSSGNSLINNANLVTKVYFPRILIPAASVGMGLVDLAIASLALLVLMLHYGVTLSGKVLMVPVLVMLTAVLALGIGLWVAALTVRYRDFRHLLPFTIQIWMFLSPIIYPMSLVPEKWRWLAALNPLCGIIENIRIALLNTHSRFDWFLLGPSVAISLLLLISASFVFRRVEQNMADMI
jgi:lipopolysaccharide transport system permease protein